MSDYERNKGVLIPFNMHEDFAKDSVMMRNETLSYSSYIEQVSDDPYYYFGENIIKIKGQWYEVVWEVKGENDIPEYAEAFKHDNGSIEFHTYHYNGGAHWTEVVEDALDAQQ